MAETHGGDFHHSEISEKNSLKTDIHSIYIYIILLICYHISMKDKRISITRASLEKMDRTQLLDVIFTLYNDNVAMSNKNMELEKLVAELRELRMLANESRYSPSTESVQYLFPELEAIIMYGDGSIADEPAPGEEEAAPAPAQKKPRKARKPNLVLPPDTDVAVIDNTEGAAETIIRDGIEYKRGKDEIILKLGYRPSKRTVIKEINPTWVAAAEAEKGEKPKIIGFSNGAAGALSCDASIAADIVVSKFDDSIPLYRYSEICEREGLNLSRQTISSWLQTYYGELAGFDRYFSSQVFRMNAMNQDETYVEVLDVKGPSGKASSGSFVIIRVGTTFDESSHSYRRVVSLSYSEGRSRSSLFDGFEREHFNGPLMTDGLKGYMDEFRFDQKKHAVCWVHAIRHFKRYAKLNPGNSTVMKVIALHSQLYLIEDECRRKLESGELDACAFIEKRKAMARPVIDAIFSAIDGKYPSFTDNNELGKGLSYLRTYRNNLYVYLDYAELTPDDNVCERVAKAFAVGRKNWLFAKSVDGADASCFFYSIIETAKACGLNPYDYAEFILRFGPGADKEDYESLLPWNADLSRLTRYRRALEVAAPDPGREDPYILTGFSR